MNKALADRHVELLSRAVVALRDRDLEAFNAAIDESYRLDIATGDGWRDRLPLPRTIRLALLRAKSELSTWWELEYTRGAVQ